MLQQLKPVKVKHFKMKLRKFLVISLALFQPSVCVNSDLEVKGIDLTVQIYQDIPKHLCGRALANLEVIRFSYLVYLVRTEF